jgi:hypothetical protein
MSREGRSSKRSVVRPVDSAAMPLVRRMHPLLGTRSPAPARWGDRKSKGCRLVRSSAHPIWVGLAPSRTLLLPTVSHGKCPQRNERARSCRVRLNPRSHLVHQSRARRSRSARKGRCLVESKNLPRPPIQRHARRSQPGSAEQAICLPLQRPAGPYDALPRRANPVRRRRQTWGRRACPVARGGLRRGQARVPCSVHPSSLISRARLRGAQRGSKGPWARMGKRLPQVRPPTASSGGARYLHQTQCGRAGMVKGRPPSLWGNCPYRAGRSAQSSPQGYPWAMRRRAHGRPRASRQAYLIQKRQRMTRFPQCSGRQQASPRAMGPT